MQKEQKMKTGTCISGLVMLVVCLLWFSGSEGAKVLTCIECANCTTPFKAGQVTTKACSENQPFCFKQTGISKDSLVVRRGCTDIAHHCPPSDSESNRCFTCQTDLCNSSTSLHGQRVFIVVVTAALTFLVMGLKQQDY